MLDELVRSIVEETVRKTLKELGALEPVKRNIPDIMSPKQLAEYLGVSVSWVYAHTNELPREKRGNKTLFIRAEIDIWRQEQRESKEGRKQKIVHVSQANNKKGLYKVI